MPQAEREVTPVIYNPAAVKLLHFLVQTQGTECFRMHWHERMELLRIHSGAILLDYGSNQEEVGAGSLVILHPSQPHRGICTRVPLEYDTIMFDVRSFYNNTDACRQYLTALQEGRTRFLSHTDCASVLRCADEVTSISTCGIHALAVTAKIYQLIFELYDHCLQKIETADPFDQVMKQVITYIGENYAHPLSTALLSSRFGYSKPYFCRKFRESTGLTPLTYLNIYRIETACRMIKSSREEISTIAAACGFSDPNYFSRCFKSHFGHPPSYYRRDP